MGSRSQLYRESTTLGGELAELAHGGGIEAQNHLIFADSYGHALVYALRNQSIGKLSTAQKMSIAEAQKEMRCHFAGGFYGQFVSAVLWAISALLALYASPGIAMGTLVFGGFLIFPLTELSTRIFRSPELSKANELRWLGMQIAFVLPISMLLLVPVVRYNGNLFYPAMMILLGAHYIPFVFLYGMQIYAGLATALAGGGVVLALSFGHSFSIGAWYTAAVLFLLSFLASRITKKDIKVKL